MDCVTPKEDASLASTEESFQEIKSSFSSRCDVAVSMTVQNMLTLDPENMTFTAMLEIDFKYRLQDFMNLFQLHDVELDPKNFEFPYIICNMCESEGIRSNHFFRMSDKTNKVHPADVSMYGEPETAKYSLDRNNDEALDLSTVIKCEKHCLVGTFRYHSKYAHQPFDEIFAFFKMATDGRPGTEYITMKFDDSDSSFVAFRKAIRDYIPLDDPVALDVDMSHEYKEATGPTYPRVYLFQRLKHRSFADFIKFYVLPSLLPLLLFFTAGDGSKDNIIETIALSSGLILADVALLFVNNSPTLTCNEQSLIFNLAYLIIGSIASSIIGDSSVRGETYRATMIIFVSLSLPLSLLLAMFHKAKAKRDNQKLVESLKARNFDYMKDLV